MLQQQTDLEKDIARSVDRLKTVLQDHSAGPCIPAFFYSASLLNRYAQDIGPHQVRSDLFEQFYSLMEDFGRHDFSHITNNHLSIIDGILQIVDSQLFIDCIRPDIYQARIEAVRSSKRSIKEKEKSNEKSMRASRTGFTMKGSLKSSESQHSKKSGMSEEQIEEFSPGLKNKTSSSFINQYDQLWEIVQRSYREHNLDQAFKIASQYVDKISKKSKIPQNRQTMIDRITQEYMAMTGFYQQFDKPGWVFDKQSKGITLEYKVFEEEKQIAIRIQGEFDIPVVQFLAIIAEIDLMGEYVPFCYDCRELKKISRNQRIGTSKIYIPLLSDRETYFYAVGYDRMKETGSLFLYSKTINEDHAFMKKNDFQVPPPNEKYVRLEYKFFIVEYTPISKKRAKIRLGSKIDMKMNYLPLFILNKSARIFAFDYFKNILEKVEGYKGSAWENKVNENPQMYQFFFSKIEQYLSK